MKKLYFFAIIALLTASRISAQSNEQKADSLRLLIETTTDDSAKVASYITLGAMYVYSDPDQAIQILHEALVFSKKTRHEAGIANCYSFLFNVHDVVASHTDSLLKYVQLLEESHKRNGINKFEIKLHWNYAIYYGKLEQLDKSIASYLKALELAREYDYYEFEQARILGNIAITLAAIGDSAAAIRYYAQALPLFGDDEVSVAITYYNMGLLYRSTDPDSALILFDDALEIANKYEYLSLVAGLWAEQGVCYDKKKQYERANQLYDKALKLSLEYNLGENFEIIYGAYAYHYEARKQYRLAIEYSKKAIELKETQEDYRSLGGFYELQEKCYVALGDYENAYKVKDKRMVFKDSLSTVELKSKVKELQTEYEVEQKELENNLLKAETIANKKTIQNRNITALALLLGLLLLGGWAVAVMRSNRQKQKYNEELEVTVATRTEELRLANRDLEQANKSLEQANYELKTFNYIASHDIKEPIRNIGSYAGLIFRKIPKDLQTNLKQYFDTIQKSSQQLYTLIEDFAKYSQMSKDDEIEMQPIDGNSIINSLEMSLSADIQNKGGRIINHGIPTIHTSASILYTILKSLVDNGLKFNESTYPTVEVSYQEQEDFYEILVKDNGIGIAPEYHDKVFDLFKRLHHREKYQGSGIGLAIVKLLVEKIGGNIQLESREKTGSTFTVQLPKKD